MGRQIQPKTLRRMMDVSRSLNNAHAILGMPFCIADMFGTLTASPTRDE